MGGGFYPPNKSKGKPQKAVVEFLCNRQEENEEKRESLISREDEDEGDDNGDNKDDAERKAKEQTEDGEGGILKFVSYEQVGDDKVLSLEWKTKYACEDATNGGEKSSSGHWGFFTWFIIM